MFIWAIFGIHKKLRLSNYSLKHGSSFWNICNLEHSYTITMTPATVCFSTVPRSIMPCKEYFILVTCQTNGEWGNSQNGVVCDRRHSDGFCWRFRIWFIPQKKNHQVSVWTKYSRNIMTGFYCSLWSIKVIKWWYLSNTHIIDHYSGKYFFSTEMFWRVKILSDE